MSINPQELEAAAGKLLSQCDKIANLQEFLGWNSEEEMDFLRKGFEPQKNASELSSMMAKMSQRVALKQKRLKGGYEDFTTPRKGLFAWFQKRRDRKELTLPIGVDVMNWLIFSERLSLLATLHDLLISHVTPATPREIGLEEIFSLQLPLAEMVYRADEARAKRVVEILKAPLHKVPASFLIHEITGYVIYLPSRGFAYYYSE